MADPYFEGAQSNLTFHVKDPRPAPFGAEADCTIPNTYFHLFAISALFDWCGSDWREHGFSYRYNEGGLTVRRAWYADEYVYPPHCSHLLRLLFENGLPEWVSLTCEYRSTYVQGSATKQPMWSETGPEANVTKYPSGKYYIRDEVWEFPITRTSPATPP
jgi:hypothetical protein